MSMFETKKSITDSVGSLLAIPYPVSINIKECCLSERWKLIYWPNHMCHKSIIEAHDQNNNVTPHPSPISLVISCKL